MPLELFTHRYQAYRPETGVAVRITLGHPRPNVFKHGPLRHKVMDLAPARAYFHAPDAEFHQRYLSQLEGHGVPRILQQLEAVAAAAGDGRLVLLCYEDLSKPGLTCHRRMFAEWWQERTGQWVRELGPQAGAAPGQLTLL
jgi:hypothetical protein